MYTSWFCTQKLLLSVTENVSAILGRGHATQPQFWVGALPRGVANLRFSAIRQRLRPLNEYITGA